LQLIGEEMSQGMIVKRGTEKPAKEFVLRGTVTCEQCADIHEIYHHYAHDESFEDQAEWLIAELSGEHIRTPKSTLEHKNEYQYPDAGQTIEIPVTTR
jgi:hypothetical protein